MVISLHNNVNTFCAIRNFRIFNNKNSNILNRLSSGIKINSASDDAANLALSKKVDSSQRGTEVANRNIQTGLTKLQTYDGYLSGIIDSLQRMRDLSVQSANGVYDESEKKMIDTEAQELMKELKQANRNADLDIANKSNNGLIKGVNKLSEVEAIKAGYTENQIIRTSQDFVDKVIGHESDDFILVSNIDMSEVNTSFGGAVISTSFTGTLDGNGHTIENLTIDSTGGNIGLFSSIGGTGEVKNLKLSSVNVTGGLISGSLAGRNYGLIENCSVTGKVRGTDQEIGGLVGRNSSGAIKNSSAAVTVTSNSDFVGGLVGVGWTSNIVSGCTSSGIVKTTANQVGGLMGYTRGIAKDSSSSANIVAGGYGGGFIGGVRFDGIVENCSASGNVVVKKAAGGFAGYAYEGNPKIMDCYATGDVTATDWGAGGFIGITWAGSTISDSYATGKVKGQDWVGGFTSYQETSSIISNCYTTSFVESTDEATTGAFVGEQDAGSTINNNCFWNTDIMVSGIGISNGTFNAQGLSTEEISQQAQSILGENWTSNGVIAHQKAFDEELSLQVGAEAEDSSYLTFDNVKLNLNFSINLNNSDNSRASMAMIDEALDYLTQERATLGSKINVLTNMVDRNSNTSYNLSEANSTIRDTDYSGESANLARTRILTQSTMSILQQAQNFNSNIILSLLQ